MREDEKSDQERTFLNIDLDDDQVVLAQDEEDLSYTIRELRKECSEVRLEIKIRLGQTRTDMKQLFGIIQDFTKNTKTTIYNKMVGSIVIYGTEN